MKQLRYGTKKSKISKSGKQSYKSDVEISVYLNTLKNYQHLYIQLFEIDLFPVENSSSPNTNSSH